MSVTSQRRAQLFTPRLIAPAPRRSLDLLWVTWLPGVAYRVPGAQRCLPLPEVVRFIGRLFMRGGRLTAALKVISVFFASQALPGGLGITQRLSAQVPVTQPQLRPQQTPRSLYVAADSALLPVGDFGWLSTGAASLQAGLIFFGWYRARWLGGVAAQAVPASLGDLLPANLVGWVV